jgi:hypothetical protein
VEADPDPSKQAFGFDFHRTFIAEKEGLHWLVGDFLGAQDTTVARFIGGRGLPHAETKAHAPFIWDFLRHFSRDRATGASVYAPIAVDGVHSLSPSSEGTGA